MNDEQKKDGVQLDLAFDMEYLVAATEAALFAVGSALSFDKLDLILEDTIYKIKNLFSNAL